MYSTSNQDFCLKDLNLPNINNGRIVYEKIVSWGQRLRKAMGEKEILSRYSFIGGEFRPPTFRAYAECLDRSCWEVLAGSYGDSLTVVPYNHIYDGWENKEPRHGFMARAVNPYEYSYQYWDKWTHAYSPNLLDNATFGAWLELLPEPASLIFDGKKARLQWADWEPRVHRFEEMGRYTLLSEDCWAEAEQESWRLSRAEAYVQAWEKMAANEPEDRYESFIQAEQIKLRDR